MPRAKTLSVVTYNIHKGMSQFGKRLVLHEIRDRLKSLDADVAFLQEVQGKHDANARRHVTWPVAGQSEFLTHEGCHSVYGMNAVYQDGHHGNAVVSRHPIPAWENIDVSHHPMESRGLLHCEVHVPGWKEPVHCINVHLGLWARSRRFQLEWLCERIRDAVPKKGPLIAVFAALVIVGGGPAGLSTLLHLHAVAPRLAERAIVLEAEAYPREKICAGGIGARGLHALEAGHQKGPSAFELRLAQHDELGPGAVVVRDAQRVHGLEHATEALDAFACAARER